MLFNSYLFVLFFLPACILGYYTINHFKKYELAQFFLLAMSLWFYAYFNISYLFIILGSIAVNYCICLFFRHISGAKARKALLLIGLLLNIGILIYYKYMDFFIRNINAVFRKEYALWGILLPLGISFFTFQQLSFVIDAYKREVPEYSLLYYASFVTFFPQLVAGPIVTHDELVPQFLDRERKRIDWDYMAEGIYIFVLGLSKKVLLADTFGNAVNWGYGHIEKLDSTNALIVMLAYTIQIYFDFSGYCDMAAGIGRMFHVDLPQNFRSPYQAVLITDFWDRWHMTLTRFFTRYVYIPLGGNRKGTGRTYLHGVFPERSVAWSQLDLCVLGSMPWGIYGGDPLLREVFPEDSESHKLGDNVSVRECDVDFLPGGLHGGCLAFSGQDHRLGFREDPGQYSGEIPADGD